jgi:cell division septum initiation protein DivIVA
MYLQTQAKMLGSRVLAMAAQRAAADPFAKVKKMIKDLITRLMEEASEESDHKAWCDAELSTNEQVRKEKTDMVEKLHAEIDELKAKIAKLKEEIADLTEEVAALVAAMAEATTLRSAEKSKNEATIADAKAGQEAVAQALTVLKEFYAGAGEATALVQGKSGQPIPEIFDSAYKGMQAEAGGVVGMLEVIESDFARLEAETAAAEETAQKEYETFMADSKADKAAKKKEIEDKGYKLQDEQQALIVASESLEGYQTELDAALVYFDKLKPSCIEVGVSYDDRVARRKEEIASLQEALEILNGQGVGLVEATNE